MNPRTSRNGFVITLVLTLIVVATLIASAFLFSARHSMKTVDQWRLRDRNLLSLQSAQEQVAHELDQELEQYKNPGAGWLCLRDAFEGVAYNANITITNTHDHAVSVWMEVRGPVTVPPPGTNGTTFAVFTNTATIVSGKVTNSTRQVVRYQWMPPLPGVGSVFDNAYYIDHHATFNGVNADFNGDVRINGNVDFKNNSALRINGDIYATGEVLTGSYSFMTWADYSGGSSAYPWLPKARPMLYTDKNTSNTNTYWPMGYSGKPNEYEWQPPPDMPYIGPLQEYEDYAKSSGGTLTTGGKTVNAVWGDDAGENAGLGGTYDSGCLVITNGATINGAIVARGDVYIKGTIKGQGTIYAGRNIYVIGDITYADASTWPKPDSNPEATAAENRDNSFLGLCAKGNVILGNFFIDKLDKNETAVAGPSHASDASDALLGYVNYTQNDKPMFNGNYEQRDGQNHNAVRTDGKPRLMYHPMLGEDDFEDLGVKDKIERVDGVLYANHMIGGWPNGTVINGSVVCRDEFLTRNGNLTLNWDIRLGSYSKENLGIYSRLPETLPRVPITMRRTIWTELVP